MKYAILSLAILAEVVATSLIRDTHGFTRPGPSAATIFFYALSFYCLSLAVRNIPTGVVYATWSGVGIVLVALAAWIFRGQRLDAPALIGVCLIITGALVMNLFSKTAA